MPVITRKDKTGTPYKVTPVNTWRDMIVTPYGDACLYVKRVDSDALRWRLLIREETGNISLTPWCHNCLYVRLRDCDACQCLRWQDGDALRWYLSFCELRWWWTPWDKACHYVKRQDVSRWVSDFYIMTLALCQIAPEMMGISSREPIYYWFSCIHGNTSNQQKTGQRQKCLPNFKLFRIISLSCFTFVLREQIFINVRKLKYTYIHQFQYSDVHGLLYSLLRTFRIYVSYSLRVGMKWMGF